MNGQPDPEVYHFDGHKYEYCHEYDLRDDFQRFAFEKKLGLFMGWFDDASEIYADEESGHRHFEVGELEVRCNLEKVDKRTRRIYWELVDHNHPRHHE